jgi:hypothetical protein
MPQLFFKGPLQDAIRAGTKRTTIRRWPRAMMQAGQRAYVPGLGWLAIEAVDSTELDDLDDRDAQADGFESAAALRDVLFSLYPAYRGDGKHWFRVAFKAWKLISRPADRKRKKRGARVV